MGWDPDRGSPVGRRLYRRRRWLLLVGVALIAVMIVVVVRIASGGDDGDGSGSDRTAPIAATTPTVEPGASAAATFPPQTTEPPTITEPRPSTTTAEPPSVETTEPPPTATEPPLPPTTTTAPPPTATTAPPTTTTTELPPTTATASPAITPIEPLRVAMLSGAGIPVIALERTEYGYVVRTPCGNTAEIIGGQPIGPVRVVLDPGHGGPRETGTVGPNGLVERDLNLTLTDAVLVELAGRGIAAATTRTGDYGVRLGTRIEFADALEAEALVSIHHNGPTWDARDTPGTEVYVQSASPDQARPASARLGGLLYEEITAALGAFENVQWSGLPDAGVKRVLLRDRTDTYALIRHPLTPSALVEYGYLTNASEAELFATAEYIQVAATATADAIEAFLETDRPGTGFVEEPRIYDPAALSIDCTDPPLDPEPFVPTEPYVPTEPFEPIEPFVPTEPFIPTEPYVPTQPFEPFVPVEPFDPTGLLEPPADGSGGGAGGTGE